MLWKEKGMLQVNNINSAPVTAPMFRGKDSIKIPEIPTGKNVLEGSASALSVYNQLLVNRKNIDIKAVDLIYDTRKGLPEGEKVYSSDGNLNYIVQNDSDNKILYELDPENEEITSIKLFNKEGQLLKLQGCDNSENPSFEVIEYPTDGKNYIKYTYYANYEQGSTYINTNKNGEVISIGKYNDGTYFVDSVSADKKHSASFDMNNHKQITSLSETKERPRQRVTNRVNFYNGVPYSVDERKEKVIPNFITDERINRPELKPAEKYVAEADLSQKEGKKTYYSDGSLESNTTDEGTFYFSPAGDLTRAELHDKTVDFNNNDGAQVVITETLDEKTTKTTTYYELDNDVVVTLEGGDKNYRIGYNYDSKTPVFYKEENSEGEETFYIELDSNGCVNYVCEN